MPINLLRKHFITAGLALTLLPGMSQNAPASFFSTNNICFRAHITMRETGPVDETFNFKLHVKPVDTSSCVAHALVNAPPDNPAFIAGVCRIGPNYIYLNLTESQVHKGGQVDTEVMQLKLDAATLNGTLHQIAHDFNTKTRTFDQGYADGTVTKVACP